MANIDVSPHPLHTGHKQQYTLTDGGIETALTDRLGVSLPDFAAFVLLDGVKGADDLREYYRPFIEIANREGLPIILDTATWRANRDWGALLGFDEAALERINADAVHLVREVASQVAPNATVIVAGSVGPRYSGDNVDLSETGMTAEEAENYHAPQIAALVEAGVDRIAAVTMSNIDEAAGIVRAARAAGVPVTVSFEVGADGLVTGGALLARAILAVDEVTDSYAEGFLVNCAHPTEVAHALVQDGHELAGEESRAVTERIIGFRLNAARHGDEGLGDAPEGFAQGVLELRALAPAATVFGGCCGTDAPHIEALARGLTDS